MLISATHWLVTQSVTSYKYHPSLEWLSSELLKCLLRFAILMNQEVFRVLGHHCVNVNPRVWSTGLGCSPVSAPYPGRDQQNLGAAQPKDCGAPSVGAALPRAWSALQTNALTNHSVMRGLDGLS